MKSKIVAMRRALYDLAQNIADTQANTVGLYDKSIYQGVLDARDLMVFVSDLVDMEKEAKEVLIPKAGYTYVGVKVVRIHEFINNLTQKLDEIRPYFKYINCNSVDYIYGFIHSGYVDGLKYKLREMVNLIEEFQEEYPQFYIVFDKFFNLRSSVDNLIVKCLYALDVKTYFVKKNALRNGSVLFLDSTSCLDVEEC